MAESEYKVDSLWRRASDAHRWDWFPELSEEKIPPTDDYDHFKQQFDRNIKDIMPLLTQWEVIGWTPVVKNDGGWRYEAAFNYNNGSFKLFSEFGKKFVILVELFEYLTKCDDRYSAVKEETLQSIRKIRYSILRFRWKKYSEILLKTTNVENIKEEFESKIQRTITRIDVFRILCLDYLCRNQHLNQDEIAVIWNEFDNEEHDLSSFRERVDSICNSSPIIYDKKDLAWQYTFKEFEEYGETFDQRLIPHISGKLTEGFTKLDGLEKILHYIMES